MAIVVVDTASTVAANGANPSLSLATASPGDLVIAFTGHGITDSSTVGLSSSGYTQIATDTASAPAYWIGYKFMGGTPDTSVVGLGEGNANDAAGISRIIISGVDTGTPLDVSATFANGNSTNPNPAAIVSVTDGCLIVVFAISMSNDGAVTGPSGYSNHTNFGLNETTDDCSIAVAALAQVSAGSENPPAWSGWNTALWKTVTLAIRPAGGGGGGTVIIPTPMMMTLGVGS